MPTLTKHRNSHVARASSSLAELSEALRLGEDGIWYASQATEISHPEDYQEWYRDVEDSSYWFRHRALGIVSLMQRFAPDGAVLDVGGGNGHVSLAMQNAGYAPVLVEPSASAARAAQERGIREVVCSTLQDAQFHDGVIAAAGMFDVLEHIEDHGAFLTDIVRTLRPAGRIYITVPAYQWLWSEHDEQVGHFRRYTLKSLCRVLSDSGFEIEHLSYMFAPLTAPVLLFRSLPYRIFGTGRAKKETFAKEHGTSGGLMSRGINALLAAERSYSRTGLRVPLGTSCVAVARKQ